MNNIITPTKVITQQNLFRHIQASKLQVKYVTKFQQKANHLSLFLLFRQDYPRGWVIVGTLPSSTETVKCKVTQITLSIL